MMSSFSSARAGQLRPASLADFSQYAKNLSWLLQFPLQAAQELLARAYGYSNAHEVRAELAKPGASGPFDEPVAWPQFSSGGQLSRPFARRGETELLDWLLESSREERFRVLLQGMEGHEVTLSRRALGALESGFFCSPKEHKRLFAQVKAGCIALEHGGRLRLAWLRANWPVGYWPLLRQLYGVPRLEGAEGSRPHPMAVALCRFRAPYIYVLMAGEIGPSLERWAPLFSAWDDPDSVVLGSGAAGLFADNQELLFEVVDEFLGEAGIEIPENLIEAVYESMDRFIEDGQENRHLLHSVVRDVPDLPALLANWRLTQLYTTAQSLTNAISEEVIVLTHRGPWPGQRQEKVRDAMTVLELARGVRDEMAEMIDAMIEFQRVEVSETEGTGMSLWRYHAAITHIREKTMQATFVGSMHGWLIVPFDEQYSVHPATFFETMDAVSAQLNDVWKVLQGQYFPSKGYGSITDFLEENPYRSIATAELHLQEPFRGKGLVPEILDLFQDSIVNAPYSALDVYWEGAALAAGGATVTEELLEDLVNESSLAVAPPAVFVIPVEGDEPPDRILRPHLRGELRPLSRPKSGSPEELLKHKLIRHFEGMRDECSADIVCYDPYDYPGT